MVKTRFSTTDVRAMVRDLRASVLGLRVVNVYDVDHKTYLFKMAVPGKEKVVLLLESGVRFHATAYARDKSDMPSVFAMKLRKALRTKRLEDIRQLGTDRVVDFTFGSSEGTNHVILEMYAAGNIVLTDQNYQILALLRTHQYEEDVAVKLNEIYPVAFATRLDDKEGDQGVIGMDAAALGEWIQARIQEIEQKAAEAGEEEGAAAAQAAASEKPAENADKGKAKQQQAGKGKGKQQQQQQQQKKKKARVTLRQVLLLKESGISKYGPEIIDHCVVSAGLKPNMKLTGSVSATELESLASSLRAAPELIARLDVPGQPGYITLQSEGKSVQPAESKQEDATAAAAAAASDMYAEFLPMLFAQHEGHPVREFPSFNDAVDEFYCRIEEQKLQRTAVAAEEAAQKRIDKFKEEQQSRIQQLSEAQELMQRQAMLLEYHSEDVDKACLVINSALAHGLGWDEIEDMVKTETANRNPIASLIKELKLESNAIVLSLSDPYAEQEPDEDDFFSSDNDEDRTPSQRSVRPAATVDVEVDLALTAYANVREIYERKKKLQDKEQKTVQASRKALQQVEQTTHQQLQQQQVKRNLQAVRKVHWFEKFNWFLTSEGYLVLSGRDAQQNELLVKRYMQPGDIYVHADIQGAASCIVKAKAPGKPVSPIAIQEAGTMAVCRSTAWAAKIVIGAWWVHHHQVSKTAPTGEYLTTGSFIIRGRKNFLPPASLEMGLGVVFRLEESSIARHLGEWKERDLGQEDMSLYSLDPSKDLEEEYQQLEEEVTAGVEDIQLTDKEEPAAAASTSAAAELESAEADAKEEQEEEERQEEEQEEQEVDETEEQGQQEEKQQPQAAARKRLTAHQRRQAKKAQKGGDASAAEGGEAEGRGSRQQPKKEAQPKQSKQEEQQAAAKAAKKVKSKKKARKYAEQDEEDRALAMLALGHKNVQVQSQAKEVAAVDAAEDLLQKQKRAGVAALQSDDTTTISSLPEALRVEFEQLIAQGLITEKSIDSAELRALMAMGEDDARNVVELFKGADLKKVGNKTRFLAGIMRRVEQQKHSAGASDQAAPVAHKSRKAQKQEQEEVDALLKEEGLLDEAEGSKLDEIEKLTAQPFEDDVLLFAIPMCAPYASMQKFKYKVKLTPGTGKKGKAAKAAVEVFTSNRACTPREKQLIKAMTDPEMVAVMIGEVKLSVPGLQASQKNKKQAAKGKSKQR